MFRMYLINVLYPYYVPNRMEEITQSIKCEEYSSNQPSGVQSAQTTQLLAGMTVEKSKIENLRSVMTGILSDRKVDELTPRSKERKKSSEQAGNKLMECPDFERLSKKEDAFKEFCRHILAIVVGRSQMATMGQRYGNARKTFEEAVNVSNEQFRLMVIDDRWEL